MIDQWAEGCDVCRYGLINPPPANIAMIGMYAVRAIQMHQGLLDICECEAGVAYRQYLTRQLAKIQSEEDYIAGDYWKKIIDDTRQWRAEYGAIRVPTAIASGITQ